MPTRRAHSPRARWRRKLEEDVAFRMLAAGNFPQHRTVCEFRRRHLAEFSELFVGVVQVAREMGLARFGKLSVDGTKVRANASKRKAMSYERMGKEAARLQAEIEALLRKAGMVDAEEDERWGEDFRGDELPEELQRREKRLAAIQAAKARLEAAQRGRDDERGREPGQDRNPRGGRPYKRAYGEPEPKAQSNFTDPESQIMKTSSEGFQQCYNAQMAVDGEHQIIVATQVGPQASDQGQLVGMLDEINETFGVEPAVVPRMAVPASTRAPSLCSPGRSVLRKGAPSPSSGILSDEETRKPVTQVMSALPDANMQGLLNDFLRMGEIERQAHKSQVLASPVARPSPESAGTRKRRCLQFASILPAKGNSALGEVS